MTLRAAIFLSLSLWVSVSHAGDPAVAEALFDEGRRLLREGKLDAACEKLAASYDEDASVGTMLNLARCNEQRGKTATAWIQYQEAAKLADKLGDVDRAEVARELATDVEAKLSHITIDVPTLAEGGVVKRNGKPVRPATFGVAIAVDPGVQRIEVTAPGKVAWSSDIRIAAATDELVVVPTLAALQEGEHEPAIVVIPRPQPDEEEGVGALTFAGIGVAAVGLAGIATGIALGALATSDRDAALGSCPDNGCDDAGFALVESARTKAHGSTAAFVIGGAALTGGVFMIIGGAF